MWESDPEQRALTYGIVEGMDMRDSRTHNYPPRWNAAPSQDLLVIRRNHENGTVSLDPLRWGFIPHWCKDPTGGRRPPCLIFAEHLRRRSPARLLFVMDIQKLLAAAVFHDKARA